MTRVPTLGPRGEGWLALQGVCFALIAAGVWSAPPPPGGDVGVVLQTVAYAIGIAGALLIGSGLAELRRANALAAVPRPRPDSQLAETGAYRLVRHPIYGGLILGALGLALHAPWIGSFVPLVLLAIVLDLKRRREEAWLAERYPGYPDYRRRTKALIPFLY